MKTLLKVGQIMVNIIFISIIVVCIGVKIMTKYAKELNDNDRDDLMFCITMLSIMVVCSGVWFYLRGGVY